MGERLARVGLAAAVWLGGLVGLVGATASLTGCGGAQGEASLERRTIVRRGFRFLLPEGADWVVREDTENQTYSMTARRTTDGTFAETVSVYAGRHPFQFVDAVDFGDQMTRMVRRGYEDERYRVDDLDVRLDDRFGPLCVRRQTVVQDARAQGVASVIPLEVRTLGYTFVLPSDRGRLVHVDFSARGTAAEVAASGWQARAEAFIAGIELRGAR